MVGVGTVGVATVEAAHVRVATVGVATVEAATVRVATVGVATVEAATVAAVTEVGGTGPYTCSSRASPPMGHTGVESAPRVPSPPRLRVSSASHATAPFRPSPSNRT